jgi:DNA-binding Lrp family transcriptional regulator
VRRVQVGVETYMNTGTGELIDLPKFKIEGGDINFEKAWIWHLCDAYELVGNKSVEILNFLVEHRDNNNLVLISQRALADEVGVSTTTVSKIMKKLKSHDIISMPQQSVYRINPEMMWKGTHKARMQVLYEYKNEKAHEVTPTDEERLQALARRSELLMNEIAKIQKEMQELTNEEREAAAE